MLSKNLFDEKTLEVNSISDYLTVSTPLPQYLPYPRFLLDTDLSHTAKLLYTLLLDRATLSQKNNWIDAQGCIYVVYPLSSLAKDLRCSISSITRSFTELENAQLVERTRSGFSKPSRILLKVPHTTQNCAVTVCKNAEDDCAETSSIYNIVDSRYRSRKPLIVTTNLTLDEIRHPQDTAHARIYDRLLEMCIPISCIGVSFRKENAQEKLERLKILIG